MIRKHGLARAEKGLDAAVRKVIGANSKAAEDYRKGKGKALHFLVGECMRETRGRADANEIKRAILRALKKGA
jgi:aspartyl-tRNA(Asn)/glutamyl-tRNA(Gln) amidotransferase subunit B